MAVESHPEDPEEPSGYGPVASIPPSMTVTLFEYQGLASFRLLIHVRAILADAMGLGKTVILLALLCALRNGMAEGDSCRKSNNDSSDTAGHMGD